ncbi:MAG: hypothetical protein WC356_02740 [Candidatus Micrarchaeia archaeon]|jgi:hypothetical protein
MADEFTHNLGEIRTRFRTHIGKSSTSEITSATCNKWINDAYRNHLPEILKLDKFKSWHTQALSATDNGKYAILQTELDFTRPVFLNGEEIIFEGDTEKFFTDYPEDGNEQYITAPTLAIGSSDTKKIKHSTFSYLIGGYSYSKTTSEVSFSGLSTIPQNKYGAFALKINSAGTITISQASGNATGYATPALAIEGLNAADSDSAFMGFVTVISTDSGGFIPGTTALDNAAITDTYTDGDPDNRGTPETVAIFEDYIYVRPRANDTYQLKCPVLGRPDALSSDSDTPLDIKWGALIAALAALLYLTEEEKDTERANDVSGIVDYHVRSINQKKYLQMKNRQIERNY